MNEMIELSKKFIMVNMDDAMISTDEKPIIGTEALATCTGVLIYCEELKKAIVAHISSDYNKTIDRIFKLIIDNKLYRFPLKYKIILGADKGKAANYHGIIAYLEKHFKEFPMIEYRDLYQNDIMTDKNFSNQFAFDASKGIFVTDRVFFDKDYYMINDYDNNSSINKHR